MKGQMASADFIVSAAMACLAIGILVHLAQVSHLQWRDAGVLYSRDADVIAQGIATNLSAMPVAAGGFCYQYSNGTGNCLGFSCNEDALQSRRVVPCLGSPNYCLLEVRVCR